MCLISRFRNEADQIPIIMYKLICSHLFSSIYNWMEGCIKNIFIFIKYIFQYPRVENCWFQSASRTFLSSFRGKLVPIKHHQKWTTSRTLNRLATFNVYHGNPNLATLWLVGLFLFQGNKKWRVTTKKRVESL